MLLLMSSKEQNIKDEEFIGFMIDVDEIPEDQLILSILEE